MKPESGAPAFDNVDELLAERIVKHGRRHSEPPKAPQAAPSAKQPFPETVPQEDEDDISGPLIVAGLVALLAILFLFYRLFDRKTS